MTDDSVITHKLILPEGHVIVSVGGYVGNELGLVSEVDAVRILLSQHYIDVLRVVPREWVEERRELIERHRQEHDALSERMLAAPRYTVSITLEPSA